MPPADDTRQAILRKARDQENERLRRLAQRQWPDLAGDDLDDKMRELQRAKLDSAGALGRASQRRDRDAGRRWHELQPEAVAHLEEALRIVRDSTAERTPAEEAA